jgi:hypothetical protein
MIIRRSARDAQCQRTSENQAVLPIELRHETLLHQNSAARVSGDDEPCLANSRQSFVLAAPLPATSAREFSHAFSSSVSLVAEGETQRAHARPDSARAIHAFFEGWPLLT